MNQNQHTFYKPRRSSRTPTKRIHYDISPDKHNISVITDKDFEFSPYQHRYEQQVSFRGAKKKQSALDFSPYSSGNDFESANKENYRQNIVTNSKRRNLSFNQDKCLRDNEFLIYQLTNKNRLLEKQNHNFQSLISKLEKELIHKASQLNLIQLKITEQRNQNQRKIKQLNLQIKALLEQKQFVNRKIQNKHQAQFDLPYEILSKDIAEQLTQIINKEYYKKIIKDKDPGRIKYSTRQLKTVVSTIIKRNIKLESFANCLIDMRTKITKEPEQRDLKKCWKWLKALVEQCWNVRKIRNLCEKVMQKMNAPNIESALNKILQY